MPAPWNRGQGPHAPEPNPSLRISDADRNEVTEQLSRHYADGRLDQGEFDERVAAAMAAKTRGDLSGLLSDLPPLADPTKPIPPPPPPAPRRWPLPRLLFLAVVIVATAEVARTLTHPFGGFFGVGWLVGLPWRLGASLFSWPWLLIALIAFLWLRDRRRRG